MGWRFESAASCGEPPALTGFTTEVYHSVLHVAIHIVHIFFRYAAMTAGNAPKAGENCAFSASLRPHSRWKRFPPSGRVYLGCTVVRAQGTNDIRLAFLPSAADFCTISTLCSRHQRGRRAREKSRASDRVRGLKPAARSFCAIGQPSAKRRGKESGCRRKPPAPFGYGRLSTIQRTVWEWISKLVNVARLPVLGIRPASCPARGGHPRRLWPVFRAAAETDHSSTPNR